MAALSPFYQAVDYTATLSMPLSQERDALVLMDPERRNFLEQARSIYPVVEVMLTDSENGRVYLVPASP